MTTAPPLARAQFSIERTYAASIDQAWALWTTRAGIESWWGPEGFGVTVTSLDLRPGGELVYLMTATAPQQVAFMKQAGMPLSTECKVTYTEVSPPGRLAYLWHLRRDRADATEVEIRFIERDDAPTLVEIEHRGWERLGPEGEGWRDRNHDGWVTLLPHYIAAATRP